MKNMLFDEKYKKLNIQQKRAVDKTEGPVMVVAGPGSGKTELLSMRVANILRKNDVYPGNILCLTFTDAAAKNMRDRLAKLISLDAYKVNVHTFHSFAMDVSDKFQEDFYDSIKVEVADEIIQIDIINNILKDFSLTDAFSKKKDDGFIYLKSIRDKIDKLKKAGISPKEYREILKSNENIYKLVEEIIIPVFDNRISKKILDKIPNIINDLENLVIPNNVKLSYSNLIDYKELLLNSLRLAYKKANEQDSTKPITKWKKAWLKKDSNTKELKLIDSFQLKVNFSLAYVYEKYQEVMKEKSYVDFSDMILDLISVMEKKKGVLASLQEQFQYVLVDEFQDTNEAQMRIINLLLDNPVNEGKPNIMVVGDDDQTIYKFQGAEVNNILQFRKRYPETEIITLLKNYRSTKDIVNFAQKIISQGEERLENKMKEVKKDLEAANPNIPKGNIFIHTFNTALHEYQYIAQEIEKKISSGYNPDDIAIISRNHKDLQAVAKFLQNKNIPIKYEKQKDVLKDLHIQQLLTIARLVQSIFEKRLNYQNYLMPEVLSFSFWGIKRDVIWQLSLTASQSRNKKERGRWLDIMLESSNLQLNNIANWLIDTAEKVGVSSLEDIIDIILGPSQENTEVFTSPFRRYYFNKQNYKENTQRYLELLSSLNVFLKSVYNYTEKISYPRLNDLIKCVDMYIDHFLPITDNSPYISGAKSVSLLTAHKAKGLEFKTVFVLSCQGSIWAQSRKHGLINFPKNVAIEPKEDNLDDYLRLFFVALTRAQSYLYITGYVQDDKGSASLLIPFLNEDVSKDTNYNLEIGHIENSIQDTIDALEDEVFSTILFTDVDEKVVLQPVVDNYIMSVTHLNNFLNVVDSGPYVFLEKNLLFFPEAKKVFMLYGSAMHATMEELYKIIKINGYIPEISKVQRIFKDKMEKANLEKREFENFLEKGNKVWEVYIDKRKAFLSANHKIETNFRMQQVVIGDIQITGKIDKIVPDENNNIFNVYDFKTGKYKKGWNIGNKIEKARLHNYKRQLIFYKILVENSRDFSRYKVNTGNLEFLSLTEQDDIFILPYDITDTDVERLKKLIMIVGKKIKNLDFPDISKYDKNIDGIISFEDDLINGVI